MDPASGATLTVTKPSRLLHWTPPQMTLPEAWTFRQMAFGKFRWHVREIGLGVPGSTVLELRLSDWVVGCVSHGCCTIGIRVRDCVFEFVFMFVLAHTSQQGGE